MILESLKLTPTANECDTSGLSLSIFVVQTVKEIMLIVSAETKLWWLTFQLSFCLSFPIEELKSSPQIRGYDSYLEKKKGRKLGHENLDFDPFQS